MLEIGLHFNDVLSLSSKIIVFLVICYARLAEFMRIRAPINGFCLQFGHILCSLVLNETSRIG